MESEVIEDGKVVSKRGAKAYKRWEPKKWQPVYDSIVLLSCTGLDNEEVGKRFGYGKQQVSNILNTEQAKKLIAHVSEELRTKNVASLNDRVERAKDLALQHIEKTLEVEHDRFKNPLAIFDRALSFLNKAGLLVGGDTKPVGDTNINIAGNAAMVLPSGLANTLTEGLQRSLEVQKLHGPPIHTIGPGFERLDGQPKSEDSAKTS